VQGPSVAGSSEQGGHGLGRAEGQRVDCRWVGASPESESLQKLALFSSKIVSYSEMYRTKTVVSEKI
jgi:hypothetical protein